MDTAIDFVLGHLAEIFYVALGVGVILYSCLVKRFTFEGDIAVRPEDRKFHKATPAMRKYGVVLGMFPLLYGLYLLFSPFVMHWNGSKFR